MYTAWDPLYVQPLPPGHPFPMQKYKLLPDILLAEGTVNKGSIITPGPAPREAVLKVHTEKYVHSLETETVGLKAERRIGFPCNQRLVERAYVITGGTLACALTALQEGVALNTAGGTHHAYPAHGGGYCIFNDIAVAAQYLLDNGKASNIWVIDLDVHQGDGTAKIFSNEPRVFTFSMHCEKNYPLRKEKSDMDIALPAGCKDNEYLARLSAALAVLTTKKGGQCPDIIFYQAGVDVLSGDLLGALSLSHSGCRERDAMVFGWCKEQAVPVTVVMGGGYSKNLTDIVEAHANTFREAGRVLSKQNA